MARLRLSLACGDYDRTRALEEESVRPDGIELTFVRLPVEEIFFRMMRHREFDVAEMSLSSYVLSLHQDPQPFVAIPVFTSRMFRHSSIYCHVGSGVEAPEDLRGKDVGTPEFQLTAGVWVRGLLAEHHGVPVDSVRYLTGGQETPGRVEKQAVASGLDIQAIGPGKTLARMLVDGEISALYTPRIPSPFAAGDPRVRRLFADVVETEQDYFARTGIFPIMHVMSIRREVYERDPWVAQSLVKAFALAKQKAEAELYDSSALRIMSPWLVQQLEADRHLLGPDFWSYGLEPNRDVLSTFLRYHHGQGLSPRLVSPHELFVPESTESALI